MKISIIVPVYNVETFVMDCLNSVSDLNLDYEIVVVNDGSKDDSLRKVTEFASSYEGDIKVINKENGGLSSARNAGIAAASGDYIFFLDSDDYIDKMQFESFAHDAMCDGVDIGFANCTCLRHGRIVSNVESEYRRKVAIKRNDVVDGLTYGDRFFDTCHNYFNVEACFLLVNKTLLDSNHIWFKQGIYHEDVLFTMSCLMVAKRVRYYDYPFYVYRMRDDSIMHTLSPKCVEKKFKDKEIIALELLKLKVKSNISALFIDTLIVDLYLVSVMHFKRKTNNLNKILSLCGKLTIKTRVRLLLYRLISFSYA